MTRPRKVLLLLLGLYVAYGALLPYVPSNPADVRAAKFLMGLPTAIALFTRCKLDSAERHVTAPPAAPLLVGAFPPIGVPFYFLRTMPLRQALFATLKAALYLVAIGLAGTFGSWISSGKVV